MTAGTWSDGVDPNTPSPARMYDYYLGGDHNFAADREAAEQVIAAVPNARAIARANRAFLGNAVRYLLDQGIRQFLDIGSGIPTVGNVHEIVAHAHPPARVVYVDVDPVAVAHSVNLLHGNPNATAIRADLRYPEAILAHHNVRTLLDLSQPVALLMISMLQFVEDRDAYPAVTALRDVLAPGSYIALSHVVTGAIAEGNANTVAQIYRRSTTPTGIIRNREQITRFLDGLELIPPGLTWVSQWQPGIPVGDTADDHAIAIAGAVARKR
jgi:hypothetical protein